MIISKTPYRISFFGGGTDYPAWYENNGGAILGTTINHYNYLTCRFLPPFFKEKSRIVWSQIELVQDHKEIVHPAVKSALAYLGISKGLEIHHMSDLPARSGLGSSSAFSVGILHALLTLEGHATDKKSMAKKAIHLEQEIMKETVGIQDQIHASYGGFNHICIAQDGTFKVNPIDIPAERKKGLQDHILLFFTGISRFASEVAKEQVRNIVNKQKELAEIQSMVDTALHLVKGPGPLLDFGKLLHEGWLLKRSLSQSIAPSFIDDIYEKGIKAGAVGGKLLGAGGGGFILFFAPPEKHGKILDALSDLLVVPVQFENKGSSIIYTSDKKYSRTALEGKRAFSKYNNVIENSKEVA